MRLPARIVSFARVTVELDIAANCLQISFAPANVSSAHSRFVESDAADNLRQCRDKSERQQFSRLS
jgi:hypothetical protein